MLLQKINIKNSHYQILKEKFEPEPGIEPRTSAFLARRSTTWSILFQVVERRDRIPEVRIPVQVRIFLLRSDNVNFPKHKLWACLQLIIWFNKNMLYFYFEF